MSHLIITSKVGVGGVGLSAIAPLAAKMHCQIEQIATLYFATRPDLQKCEADVPCIHDFQQQLEEKLTLADMALLGYFASVEQIDNITALIKEKTERPFIIIDPVLGDEGKQYVSDPIRQAITHNLIPLANVITPNRFEADAIFGIKDKSFAETNAILKEKYNNGARPIIIITSAKVENQSIEIWYWDKDGKGCSYKHKYLSTAPKGTGDIFAFLVSYYLRKESLEKAIINSTDIMMQIIELSYQVNLNSKFPAYLDDIIQQARLRT